MARFIMHVFSRFLSKVAWLLCVRLLFLFFSRSVDLKWGRAMVAIDSVNFLYLYLCLYLYLYIYLFKMLGRASVHVHCTIWWTVTSILLHVCVQRSSSTEIVPIPNRALFEREIISKEIVPKEIASTEINNTNYHLNHRDQPNKDHPNICRSSQSSTEITSTKSTKTYHAI